MFESIRRFQKDNDLKVDGVMKPGGETETTLNRTRLAQADPLDARAHDENILRQFIQTRNEQRKETTAPDSKPPIPKRKPDRDNQVEGMQGFTTAQREKYYQTIEDTYKGHEKALKRSGFEQAAQNLNDFLEGKTETKIIEPSKLRENKVIQNAEVINRKRFEKRFSDDEALKKQLLSLPDNSKWTTLKFQDSKGQATDEDYWVVDIGHSKSSKRNPILQGDFDYLMASDHSKLKSNGKFQAKREGNKIFIRGDINHDWGDIYDFSIENYGAGAATLDKASHAQRYPMKSTWHQNILGEIEVNNDKIKPIQFKWEDSD